MISHLGRIFFSFGVVFLIGVHSAGTVYAWKAETEEARLALMDKEMDCISNNLNRSGSVSWQNTCSSYYDTSSSSSYDEIAKSDDTYSDYYTPPDPYYAGGSDRTASEEMYDSYADRPSYISSVSDYSYDKHEPSGEAVQTSLRFMAGLRRDDLDWNFASDITGTTTPNILSELTWEDVRMVQLKLAGDVVLFDNFVFDGMVAYSDIYDGDNQDSDYLGDDRTLEFSRSNNSTDGSDALDWSMSTGYRIYLGNAEDLLMADNLVLTLLTGYSHSRLNLIITDGSQTIPAAGSFDGLESSYMAKWSGPWIGFNLEGEKDRIFGNFRFEYHWADYYGSANWNLRPDRLHPKSYEHVAEGHGLLFNLGAGYRLTDSLTLDFEADIQDWQTDPGTYRPFFADGTVVDIRLNEVNWQSRAFMLGSTYQF